MADQPLHSLMGQNHRRVISIRLRLLEEYSTRLLELFQPLEAGLTSRPALPPTMAERMEREVAALHAEIRSIKADLDLDHSHRSAKREAAALISTMITYVEELHPRYMKGYGEMADPVSRYLQEHLKGLTDALEKINRTLKDGQ